MGYVSSLPLVMPLPARKQPHEIGAEFAPLDVANTSSIDAFAEQLAQKEGGLDVFVANAGITLDGFNADVARRTIDVNFYGANYRPIRGGLSLMRRVRAG